MEGRVVAPFQRGASTSQDLSNIAGNEYSFVDDQYGTNRECVVRLVKNSSSITVKGKKMCRWKASGTYHTEIDGYTKVEAEDWAGVSDDKLPTAGVAASSYFYIGVRGPFMCTTSEGDIGPVDFAVGSKVVCCTAAASTQTTDAGGIRTRNATLGATGTVIAGNIENAIGRAASVKATTQTAADILVIFGD